MAVTVDNRDDNTIGGRTMKQLLLAGIFLCASVWFSDSAEAQWGRRPKPAQGLELLGGAGMNFCMESGEAKCDYFDSNMNLLFAVGYRFSPVFGAYLDGAFGWLTGDKGAEDVSTMVVMPTARLYAPLRDAELYGALGFGFSRLAQKMGGEEISWSSWTNLKVGVGGAISISPNLSVGVNLDYVLNVNGTGEYCVERDGKKSCGDVTSSSDTQDLIQATAFLKYRFF